MSDAQEEEVEVTKAEDSPQETMGENAAPEEGDELEEQHDASKAAFSDHLENLTESLNLLFIRNNASGRNKFRDKWPHIASYIFGEELIQCDNEGTPDRERRKKLEEEAGDRRIELKATIIEARQKSVDKGVLQFEYVGEIIDRYGADVSPYIYAESIIERVRPGLLATRTPAPDKEKDAIKKTSAPSVTNSADAAKDSLEDVKPIETEAPEGLKQAEQKEEFHDAELETIGRGNPVLQNPKINERLEEEPPEVSEDIPENPIESEAPPVAAANPVPPVAPEAPPVAAANPAPPAAPEAPPVAAPPATAEAKPSIFGKPKEESVPVQNAEPVDAKPSVFGAPVAASPVQAAPEAPPPPAPPPPVGFCKNAFNGVAKV